MKYLPGRLLCLRKSCILSRQPTEANVSGIASSNTESGSIIRLINEREVTACETESPSDPCILATIAYAANVASWPNTLGRLTIYYSLVSIFKPLEKFHAGNLKTYLYKHELSVFGETSSIFEVHPDGRSQSYLA